MFLLTKMRQPSCMLYRELEVHTFSDFLDELLSDRNFLMEFDDDGHLVIPPLEPVPQLRVQHPRRCSSSLYGRRVLPQRRPLAHTFGQRAQDAALDPQAYDRQCTPGRFEGAETGTTSIGAGITETPFSLTTPSTEINELYLPPCNSSHFPRRVQFSEEEEKA